VSVPAAPIPGNSIGDRLGETQTQAGLSDREDVEPGWSMVYAVGNTVGSAPTLQPGWIRVNRDLLRKWFYIRSAGALGPAAGAVHRALPYFAP
jgi:hypothetical protein